MDIREFLKVSPYIANCPSCGSDLLGEGLGYFLQKENTITRTCECGFDFTYDVLNGTTKTKIKKAVQDALEAMND